MLARCESMAVSYEELCEDPEALARVMEFVGSPLAAPGRAGQFNEANPQRQVEAGVHGGRITSSRVARWRQVEDPGLREAMHEVHARMSEYNTFWGYADAGHA